MAKRKPKPTSRLAYPMRTYGSPIEVGLRNALLRSPVARITDYSTSPLRSTLHSHQDGWDVRPDDDAEWQINDGYSGGHGDADESLSLYAGVGFLSYRFDFVLIGENGAVGIECDGHEWHERTKQQASADRARDRETLLAGVPTIRFTGSDIHNYADDCARSAIAIALSQDSLVRRTVPAGNYDHNDYATQAYDSGVRAGEKHCMLAWRSGMARGEANAQRKLKMEPFAGLLIGGE